MKILHLIDETWDSGLSAYAIQICDLLQKSGTEVVLGVLPGKKPESLARNRGLKTVEIKNVFDLIKVLKNQKWDVVNVHTGRTHTWSLLAKFLSGRSQRDLTIIRTRGDARSVQSNPIFKFIYRNTNAVIAASEHIRKQYEEYLGLEPNKIITIYPAVFPEKTYVDFPKEIIIGILGRLDVIKGHSIFLEAAALILRENSQVRFLIAGKEAGVTLQLLQNQVKELGLAEHVEFLGYVQFAEDFMNKCSIGVIASLGSEEVSRACLEWMATGRPVVGTLVGCLPELIETEETGLLVPPGDASALSEALLRLIRQPSLIIQWGKKARNVAHTKYSPEQFLTKTLEFYKWAVKQQQAKG